MRICYTAQCAFVLANTGVQAKTFIVVSLSWPASSCSFSSVFQQTLSNSEPQHDSFSERASLGKYREMGGKLDLIQQKQWRHVDV